MPVGSSGVLLLDDLSEWALPAALLQLWTHLRLLLLESIWMVRCGCSRAGQAAGEADAGNSAGGHVAGSSLVRLTAA